MLLCNPGTPPQPHPFCGSEDPSFTRLKLKGWRLGGGALRGCRRGGDGILIRNTRIVLLKDHLRRENSECLG